MHVSSLVAATRANLLFLHSVQTLSNHTLTMFNTLPVPVVSQWVIKILLTYLLCKYYCQQTSLALQCMWILVSTLYMQFKSTRKLLIILCRAKSIHIITYHITYNSGLVCRVNGASLTFVVCAWIEPATCAHPTCVSVHTHVKLSVLDRLSRLQI